MKKPNYRLGERVEFMVRAPKITINGKVIQTKGYRHLVGYVKRVESCIFGRPCYIICDASKDSERFVFRVKEKDIFGVVEKREKK